MMATVYDIGDFRVEVKPDTLGLTFQGDTECPHRNLVYSETGRTVECEQCEKQIDPWWAFMRMVRNFKTIKDRLDSAREALEKDMATALTHTAALRVEKAWRRRKYVPTCPHCYKGILPMDGFGGSQASVGQGEKRMRLQLVTAPHEP
jgi:hypothetical protein